MAEDGLWPFGETCYYRSDSVLQVKLEACIKSLYNQSQTFLKVYGRTLLLSGRRRQRSVSRLLGRPAAVGGQVGRDSWGAVQV